MNLTELHHLGRQLMFGAETAMKSSRTSDLKPAELQVLHVLFTAGPLPVGEIAHQIRFAQSRVSTAVAALHERGLVTLGHDSADRRRTIVSVSEQARSRAVEVQTLEATPAVEQLFPGLSPEELTQLMTVLDRLLQALGEPAPPAGHVSPPPAADQG